MTFLCRAIYGYGAKGRACQRPISICLFSNLRQTRDLHTCSPPPKAVRYGEATGGVRVSRLERYEEIHRVLYGPHLDSILPGLENLTAPLEGTKMTARMYSSRFNMPDFRVEQYYAMQAARLAPTEPSPHMQLYASSLKELWDKRDAANSILDIADQMKEELQHCGAPVEDLRSALQRSKEMYGDGADRSEGLQQLPSPQRTQPDKTDNLPIVSSSLENIDSNNNSNEINNNNNKNNDNNNYGNDNNLMIKKLVEGSRDESHTPNYVGGRRRSSMDRRREAAAAIRSLLKENYKLRSYWFRRNRFSDPHMGRVRYFRIFNFLASQDTKAFNSYEKKYKLKVVWSHPDDTKVYPAVKGLAHRPWASPF